MKQNSQLIVSAQSNPRAFEDLVEHYRHFILKTASATTRRYLTPSDDEWSIALEAFADAVHAYSPQRGDFDAFAATVIRRRVIDWLRQDSRSAPELPVDPMIFDTPPGDDVCDELLPLRLAVAKQCVTDSGDALRQEIAAIKEVLDLYGFSFFDLASCSPKAQKTKDACAKAVAALVKKPDAMKEMRRTTQLPAKYLQKNTGVPLKILDRHRKYLIAAAEIVAGDYPYLQEYLGCVRKELERYEN